MKVLLKFHFIPFVFAFLFYGPNFGQEAASFEREEATKKLYALFEEGEGFQKEQRKKTFREVLPKAQKEQADFRQSLLDKLMSIQKDELSPSDQINYEIFRYILEDELANHSFEAYLIPFNAEGGFYNRLSFTSRASFSNKKDYQKYIQRLKNFPQYMRDNMTLMKLGIKRGIVAPKIVAQNYAGLITPFTEKTIEKHFLYRPFLNMPETWNEGSKDSLRIRGEKVLRESILPVYEEFDHFMKTQYLPAAQENIGISAIPNGRAYYEQRIAYFTSLDMPPEEVFQTGQKEVARIRAEMDNIIKELEFEGSFDDFLHFLRTDKQFYATTPKQLLKEASYIAKKIDGKLPEYFNTLPRLSYGVQPVPAAIAPNYTGGRYSPGSAKNHLAGNYWVNTYKLESRPLYVLPALTLHEAVPGHHLQIALAEEMEEQPAFRQQTYLSAFGEGWALYCEWLGKEMEIYETPYEEFGSLTYEMWRACRLVVDVGMHYKGWTREKALEFLSSNTALSLHECNTEIDRYIGWPGQAVSYKIGELKIRELRKLAEKKLGTAFNIREFHEVILKNGSVPLFVLEEVVNEYISEKLEGLN